MLRSTSLLLAALLAVAPAPARGEGGAVDLGWIPKVGDEVEVRWVLRSTERLRRSITIEAAGGVEREEASDRRVLRVEIGHRDRVTALREGRIERLDRSIGEVAAEVERESTWNGQPVEAVVEPRDRAPLELRGKRVGLTREGEGVRVDGPDAEGLSGDARAALVIDYRFHPLLPDHPVAVGESWRLDERALVRLLYPDAERSRVLADPRGGAECTLAGVEERNGDRLARIVWRGRLEFRLEAESGEETGGPEGFPGTLECRGGLEVRLHSPAEVRLTCVAEAEIRGEWQPDMSASPEGGKAHAEMNGTFTLEFEETVRRIAGTEKK